MLNPPLRSDFNGDGWSDLAVGVPGEVYGRGVQYDDAGGVHVIPGASGGLTDVGNSFWSHNRSLVGSPAHDQAMGIALATGDFDGDGYADMAVGMEEATLTGAVQIIYGTAAGLDEADNQLLTQDDFSCSWCDVEMNDLFGRALASGDFDGDGYDDLAIGTPGETH